MLSTNRGLLTVALVVCGITTGWAESTAFPSSDYTPHGYLDNPHHSAVLNRSGVIRSVPPLGFGFWARGMPWPYGAGAQRPLNYLSVLHLGIAVDGARFQTADDFAAKKVQLASRYHTKNLFSYDWEYQGLSFTIRYVFAAPDSLIASVRVHNSGAERRTVTLQATNEYGYPEKGWWGSDGVAAKFTSQDAGISKMWAYGDVFALGADRNSIARKATASEQTWNRWLANNDTTTNDGASLKFETASMKMQSYELVPAAIYTMQTYQLTVAPRADEAITLSLARGVNESAALAHLRAAIETSPQIMKTRVADDNAFYANAPILTGDWASEWKHGWTYDFETLRLNIRPPVGIYKHHWDGMQVFTPRSVLGEAMLDAMALSYADVNLAKEVILGTFADAPAPNIPCSREDGSVNMICADGSEAGTAPTWGMPFHVVRSIYSRDQDAAWIKALYPHMKSFLEWWLANRTDKDGWFHSKCSWESGQDGSKRFPGASDNPAAVADFVRTVDIEAAMASAFEDMVLFADVSGHSADRAMWRQLADKRIKTTRAMFVDGWFRDFDSRTNRPIILNDYYDVMMLYPVAAGISTAQQTQAIAPKFDYFAKNPTFWLEWPSFMFPFTEAAWNAGLRDFIGGVVAGTGSRIYRRLDERHVQPVEAMFKTSLPARFQYRIPGVSDEFWPIGEDLAGGAENYGWGATLPTLVIRNMIGFREFDDPSQNEFRLAPALPSAWLQPGKVYGITNLNFHGTHSDVEYRAVDGNRLEVKLNCRSCVRGLSIRDEGGKKIASVRSEGSSASATFPARNGSVYRVSLEGG